MLILGSDVKAENWQHPDYIQQSFARIALKSEYTNHAPTLRKWRQPINYAFQHDVGDKALHEQLSNTHLSQLASITEHPIQLAHENQRANLQIIFTNESRFTDYLHDDLQLRGTKLQELSRNSVCIAKFSVNSQSEIIAAKVLIPVDRARSHGKLLACIVEELTQIMGLPNDDAAIFPSVFNDLSQDNFLSGLDYMLLKLLYQPSLKPGMNGLQTQRSIAMIAQQPKYQQWLQEADETVRAEGLYPLID